MAGLRVLCCLLLATLVYAVEGRAANSTEPDIPQRCIDNTVTPVSCEDVEVEDPSEAVLVPHPDDCELFYYCVSPDTAPVCRQCPGNLHFNPEEKVCDLPERAGCKAADQSD